MRSFLLLSLSLCLATTMAMAQSTTTTTTTSSTTSNAAQAQAIQQQITTGIENGTLSATQIQELQAQELQLQAASSTGNRAAASAITPDATDLAAQRFSQAVRSTNAATNSGARLNATGPDPFTYNSLGPDAYAAQKYQNPGYNVPAYPTTNPVPNGVTQQYNGPSAGSPYGAGYAQSPLPSGTGQNVYAPAAGTAGTAATGQGVYVYRTGQGR